MSTVGVVVPIVGQILVAIYARDLESLKTLLNGEEGVGISEHDINSAFCFAARQDWDSREACQLLCDRLSLDYKKRYKSTKCKDSPLHAAVMNGPLETVQFLLPMFNVNLMNESYSTPLWCATLIPPEIGNSLAICQLLLENGAHVNNNIQGDAPHGPLYIPVVFGHAELVCLLLEHGADPNQRNNFRRPTADAHDEENIRDTTITNSMYNYCPPTIIDAAIRHGKSECLSLLLLHGAVVRGNEEETSTTSRTAVVTTTRTSLNVLLRDGHDDRETKVTTCQILVHHAKMLDSDTTTAAFLQSTLENEINNTAADAAAGGTEGCEILLEAGFVPIRRALFIAVRAGNEAVCRLLVQHGIDPFLEGDDDDDENDTGNINDNSADDHDGHGQRGHARSPFHAAARRNDDLDILRFFMQLWHERFAASGGGRDTNGDCPIHVLCRDKYVSIQAIKMLVEEFQANVSQAAASTAAHHDGKPLPFHPFPFHAAVISDASLDVIYFLLNHFPDVALTTATTTNNRRKVLRSSSHDDDDGTHNHLPPE